MKQLLLALLDRRPAHGYELKRAYDALVAPVWPAVNIGQIYVTLGRLEREGLVEFEVEASPDGPDRKVYSLTDGGRHALRAWLTTPGEPATVKGDALMRIVAATAVGLAVTHELVRDHRQRCLEALRSLDVTATGLTRGSLGDLVVQSSALHLQADLRWLDLVEHHLLHRPGQDAAPPEGDHDGTER